MVAITGSNGKSTVTTLLYHMCRAAGHSALAGGNLGVPALDLLAEEKPDFYVLELSSFQLQRTQALPAKVAVLLNVSPDHLDWHASEKEYREAKYRIFREAKAAVINRTDRRRVVNVTADVDLEVGNPNEILEDLEDEVLPALLESTRTSGPPGWSMAMARIVSGIVMGYPVKVAKRV